MATKKVAKKRTKVSKASRTKKVTAPAKKTVKKKVVTTRKVAVKKTAVKKGDRYACDVCGLVVSVDKACGCARSCDIICCDEPMTRKK